MKSLGHSSYVSIEADEKNCIGNLFALYTIYHKLS